jgi:GDP-mannose transporter
VQVLSSVVAAWADVNSISDASAETISPASEGLDMDLELVSGMVQKLNIGYVWMLFNCMASAAYVRAVLRYLFRFLC